MLAADCGVVVVDDDDDECRAGAPSNLSSSVPPGSVCAHRQLVCRSPQQVHVSVWRNL